MAINRPLPITTLAWPCVRVACCCYKTGLIPDPVNQASVLFPLIESKDVGLILEQCYYILLVRNADALQQGRPPHLDDQGPEISLLRRLVFKHATKAFHLMPLFTAGEHQSHAE
jgi:hypothetical protein